MREIKFRVWFEDEKEMSESFNIKDLHANECFEEGEYYILTPNNNMLYGTNNEIWLQYTGLKDKNGKEVCAGDIVKCNEFIDLIEYKEDFCAFKFSKDESNLSLNNWFEHGQYTGFEVIGNIYENPELLEK